MSLSAEIMSILSLTGHFSIKSLAQRLGISSESLEVEIDRINEGSIFIERFNNDMVGFNQVSELLCVDKIRARLGVFPDRFVLNVVSETGSTNDDLLNVIRSGSAQDRLIQIAETQTAGRGTKGRSWLSIPGGSLTFSILRSISSEDTQKGISTVPLVVGLAIVRSLNTIANIDCRLKWPNDVLCHGKKLAGVLTESVLVGGQYHIVIGIGINICIPKILMNEIDQPVTDLYDLGFRIDRNVLLGNLILELDGMLEQYFTDGFDFFRQEWCQLHAYHNQRISFVLPDGQQLDGDILDVDAEGALILKVAGKVRRFISGVIRFNV
ncbi:MAG: biotin--[acetyl-CoA-carboxylase] ligase [Proteobacteria bacterium]|nr:biotin--[acetyl-CoA-carboxylase] ligase [Pseudomonadota bacterium]